MSIDKEFERKKKDEEPSTDEGIVNIIYSRLRKFRVKKVSCKNLHVKKISNTRDVYENLLTPNILPP